MLKSFKYRIYPTQRQTEMLDTTLYLCRQLYNAALQERKEAYRKCKTSITYLKQQNVLPEIKGFAPEYNDVHSQVLQDVLKRLDKAYKAFFRRCKSGKGPGHPRFQGRYRYDSFTYSQYKQTPTDKTVYLPKIGNVRIKLHRPIEGKIKTCTVKRDRCGDWFVTFSCEVLPQPRNSTGLSVGIDRGISAISATSDGELVENPKFYTKAEKALRKAQRRLKRRKKGSKRREKARLAVAKLHRKIARQRADFLHKLSTNLIRSYDLVALEDLNAAGMAKSRLAKHILDAGWSTFLNQLNYKAEYAGSTVKLVDPAYTSQTCAVCGHIAKENRQSQTIFKCTDCGHSANADINAAQNILARAWPAGVNGSRLLHAVA